MESQFHIVPGGFIAPDGRFRPSISGAEDAPPPENNDAGGGDTPPLDIAALLGDESQSDTPITIAQLKPFLEQHTGTVATQVREQLRTEREAEERARNARDESNASRNSDRTWAVELDKRLDSADPEVRAAAQTEKEGNRERYIRGMAYDYEDKSTETMVKAVNAHMEPRMRHLTQNNEQAFVDAMADPAFLQQYSGNELLAAIRFGDERGYQRGLHEAEEQADRDRRAEEASGGAHDNNGGGGAGSERRDDDLWAGIDRSKPGAWRLYQQRVDARKAQQQRR